MPLVILTVLTVLIIGLVVGQPYWRQWQRRRVLAKPFPEAWRKILKQRMPYFRALPADLQLQLKKHIQVFIAEKNFMGCDGLQVTDEMRVLSGESWGQGKVILSWQDTLAGAADPHDGHNVVIHEFAHQLDQEQGPTQGAPVLSRSSDYQQWSAVMQQAFNELQVKVAQGLPVLLDPYGATNPAEFFAVLTEIFFERPAELSTQHPDLYQLLSRFYRLNPLSWR